MSMPSERTKDKFEAISAEERIAFAHQVVAAIAEGTPVSQIAKSMGVERDLVVSRMRRPWYKAIARKLEASKRQSSITREKAQGDAVFQQTQFVRARIGDLMSKEGVEFLETCLAKDAKGEFKSRSDARYAVDRMIPAMGLNEPEDARRRLGDIKIGVILAQQAAIRLEDAKRFPTAILAEARQLPPPAAAPELADEPEGNDLDELGMPESPSPVPPE